ncbi:MAG: hypothetical protein RBR97_19870 [Bacteroidales bacterium]|jgi:hypothetical protein|nr:hypothetical protein [Bacteroidales bacterium]
MKSTLLILLSLITISGFSQTVLKGNDLSERLIIIKQKYDSKEYEAAIELFNSNTEIISEDKIKKKDFTVYQQLKTDIKKNKVILDKNSDLITDWIKLLESNEFESLMNIYKPININNIYKKDYQSYIKVSDFLKTWEVTYKKAHKNYVKQFDYLLEKNFHSDKQYHLAVDAAIQIKQALETYNKVELPTGKIYNLESDINKTKLALSKKLISVNEFIVENKPLTQQEIDKLLQSGTATIQEYEKYCNYLQWSYDNFRSITIKLPSGKTQNIDFNELTYIVQADVFGHFGLYSVYDSELKRKAFKQTEDYSKKFNELKSIQDYVLGTNFMMPIKKGCFYKYDLEKKAFKFRVSTLDGFFYSKNYLQYDELCLKKPINFKFEEGVIFGGSNYFVEQNYFVPLSSETLALEIEENCDYVSLAYIVKLVDVQSAVNAFGFTSDFITASVKQVVFYNTSNNKIYTRLKY